MIFDNHEMKRITITAIAVITLFYIAACGIVPIGAARIPARTFVGRLAWMIEGKHRFLILKVDGNATCRVTGGAFQDGLLFARFSGSEVRIFGDFRAAPINEAVGRELFDESHRIGEPVRLDWRKYLLTVRKIEVEKNQVSLRGKGE